MLYPNSSCLLPGEPAYTPRKEGNAITSTAMLPKKLQPELQKSSPILEKQDFIETVQKRPMIVKMLERMGFLYTRTGRHPIYQHPEAPGHVAVPFSVQATGTRGCIYNQAMGVLGRRDGKED